VRPGLKGDRVTLQNLAPNPGFEQGSGPAVLVFSDNFASVNAYAVQAGSAPTVASSVMTLVAGARVAFGSPAWSSLNLWQLRFKWVSGLTARFYLHYTDANNHLRAEAAGTSWALIHRVAGTPTTVATGAVTLTNGNFYWIKVTQFPSPAPSATVAPPYLTASLFNDSAGAVGSLVTNGALAGSGWNPRAFSFKPSDARGVYHLYTWLRSQQSAGNLPNLTARAAIQQLLSPWYGQSGGADQLATYSGGYVTPLVASNAWTAADVGQVAVPPFPAGTLTDLAQTYLTPRAQLGDSSGASAGAQVNWAALIPVDGGLLTALVNNPSNAPFAVTNSWLWTYFDGLGMAAGGDSAWTYSLAATALVAALPIVAQALSDGTLDWGNVARTALAAAAVAVLLALVKYARAFGDPPLEGAVDAASGVAAEPGQSDLAGDVVSG
jgi:hypothetical protein